MATSRKSDITNENIPQAITGLTNHVEHNKPYQIFSGEFILKSNEEDFLINGSIQFDWFPNIRVSFSGSTIAYSKDIEGFPFGNNVNRIYINGIEFGIAMVTLVKIEYSFGNVDIYGIINSPAILGRSDIKVDHVWFAIPNLRYLTGKAIQKQTKDTHFTYPGRIELTNDLFDLIIDREPGVSSYNDFLKNEGGYGVTYNGMLNFKDILNDHKNCIKILECLNYFISFLNGRRVSATFLHGINNSILEWIDFTHYSSDIFKETHSWVTKDSIDGINEIWNNFYYIWQNTDDQYFLKHVIHWYIEANGLAGNIEGATIMSQTALELIYNWWIVEKKKIIKGKDSENLLASNKIRITLSQMNLDPSIPEKLSHLIALQNSDRQTIIDGPEAIIQIRNGIVHSQSSKRIKNRKIPNQAKYEALQLALWYIEMSLLAILEYPGSYTNRCLLPGFPEETTCKVPWSNKFGESFKP